jgi:hypothetical protein
MPEIVRPPAGDMITDAPDEVVDPDGDAGEPTIGAATVAPAPINATTRGINTAWTETVLARS